MSEFIAADRDPVRWLSILMRREVMRLLAHEFLRERPKDDGRRSAHECRAATRCLRAHIRNQRAMMPLGALSYDIVMRCSMSISAYATHAPRWLCHAALENTRDPFIFHYAMPD